VSLQGHLPAGLHGDPGFSTLLAVAGPMARYAEDLEASMRVLAGMEYPDTKAFQWTLPPARHERLSEYRIRYILEDPLVAVSVETKAVLESAIRACERAGAAVTHGWPEGFRTDSMAKGSLSSFAEWQAQNFRRLAYRAFWQKFFQSTDVFLLPSTFTAAFAHDPTPIETRMIPLPEGGAQPFLNMLAYISPATLTGCPATTAPAGLSKSGLPVGIQIVGPYLEDGTPIRFAQLLAREIGGFRPPKGYNGS